MKKNIEPTNDIKNHNESYCENTIGELSLVGVNLKMEKYTQCLGQFC